MRGKKLSTSGTTATLNDIINNLDADDLKELCSSYCDDTSDVNEQNEFYTCQLFNLLQCYGCQFMKLILLLIFLYAWNNQATNNYLMTSNCQLTNAISDMLQDCMENNCNSKKR